MKDRNERMVSMYADGHTYAEIGEEFGVTRQRVHQIVRQHYDDEPHYGRLKQEEREQRIRAAHARIWDGSSLEEEAAQEGLKPKSLRKAFSRLDLELPTSDPYLHGSQYRYKMGCRCDECQQAIRDYRQLLISRGPPNHGTRSAYFNYGCRCDECRAAGSEANRQARIRRKQRRKELVPID